jgi:hypothetical protein
MAISNSRRIGIPMVNLGLGGGGGGASFLLDDYPNIGGHSYSLRQLSSTVNSVVRVRRASDNTEQDFTAAQITNGMLATFCGSSEGFVAKWYDQSGNKDVYNFTALQQPKIFAEDGLGGHEVLLENGKPCVEFDGGDDSLQVLLTAPFNSNYYLFAVNTWVSAPAEGDGYMYGLRSLGPVYPSGDDASNSISWNGTIGTMTGSGILTLPPVTPLTWIQNGSFPQSLYYARQVAPSLPGTGSQLKINTNQHPIIGGTPNGTAQVSAIHLGENGAGQGNSNIRLQEFILYFNDPGVSATAIESNINTHYSIYL